MKYALRYLWRNKIATSINVSGLAVAMAAAFLMLQYLDFELSYDTYLPEHKEVYRVASELSGNGAASRQTATSYYAIPDWLTENFTEVEAATRVNRWPANTGFLIEIDGQLFNEKNYMMGDKGFFKVFPSMLIAGDPQSCLAKPENITISDRLAMKLFGTIDIIGKEIKNPGWKGHSFAVTGVFHATPANSHLDADIIYTYEYVPDLGDEWKVTTWNYIRVAQDTNTGSLQEKINGAISRMLPDPKTSAKIILQPHSSIHLFSNIEDEIKAPGNITNIYIVFAALIMITLVAWINYVNLETARFLRRLKEVGIRRVIGSSKRDLFLKFFAEYICLISISLVVAIAIAWTVFPWFGEVSGLQLRTPQFQVKELWIDALLGLVVIATLAGAYPFLSIVRINPVASLKGKITNAFQGVFIRRSLVTFQLVVSLTLMALVVMVLFQLDFMRSAKLNFNTSDVITIYNPANYTWLEDSLRKDKNDVFRNRLMQIPSVENLTTSSAIPGAPIGFTYTDLLKRQLSDPDRQVHYKVMYIDYDFIPLFGLELVAGRNYSREYSDVNCLVLTEGAVRELGFSSAAEALNQQVFFQEEETFSDWDWHKWTIIGIVKDYRHESIKTAAQPGIFRLHRNKGQMVYYSIKVSNVNALPAIEQLWKETWPGKPFDYFFMDQHYDQQYKTEIHFSRIFFLFSGIAAFIACLGVMGMTLFEANARIKEIGIRKVLGAGMNNIIALLTKDTLRTLMISFVIALPVVYTLATKWLSSYPEHIDFSAWFMVMPLCVMIALGASVSLTQVIKAAVKNPVDSLKHE
jgi:putative ABC transport system permease protein